MRTLDEQYKVVLFWDNWIKAVSSTTLQQKHSNTLDEISLEALAQEARRELLRAGHVAKTLYRPKVDPTFAKYRLTFKEFHAYRSKLPWYRRALLLYKAPNPKAAFPKSLFHLMLITNIVEFSVLPLLLPRIPILNPRLPIWLMALHKTHHVVAGLVLLVCLILSTGMLVGAYAVIRRRVIKYENDPRYYLSGENS
jgi:hypothetical protein